MEAKACLTVNHCADISEVNEDLTFASGTTELTQCIDDIEALLDDRVENTIETVPTAFTVELFEGGVIIDTQDVGLLMILDMPTRKTRYALLPQLIPSHLTYSPHC